MWNLSILKHFKVPDFWTTLELAERIVILWVAVRYRIELVHFDLIRNASNYKKFSVSVEFNTKNVN
jgi:hypothetical protein